MTTRRRVLWASALVPWIVAALVWGVVQVVSTAGRPTGAAPALQISTPVPDWSAILDRLDRRCDRAYAASDPTTLRAVYVPGSPVLRHDLAVLRAYRDRGVRLTDVRLRALQVRMLGRSGPYARLRVVDRLDRVTARTSKGTIRLPRDRATARVVVLRAGPDGWRIAAVRPVAG